MKPIFRIVCLSVIVDTPFSMVRDCRELKKQHGQWLDQGTDVCTRGTTVHTRVHSSRLPPQVRHFSVPSLHDNYE